MPDKCPYCDFEAPNTNAEIAHMEAMHPEIIRERLEKAGLPMVPDTYEQVTTREWLALKRDNERLQELYEAQTENYSEENEARARAETERDKLREIIGRLYEQRGKDINALRTAIRRAFREANNG